MRLVGSEQARALLLRQTKRKRGQFTSSTFLPGIAKHLNHLKRANAHANGVNYLLQLLMILSRFGDFGKEQESKVDVHLMSLCCCYVTIRSFVLSFTLFYLLPPDPFLMDSYVFSMNYYAHYVCKYTNFPANYQILWKKVVVKSFII